MAPADFTAKQSWVVTMTGAGVWKGLSINECDTLKQAQIAPASTFLAKFYSQYQGG